MPDLTTSESILAGFMAGLPLSLAVESLLQPRPQLSKRPFSSWAHHTGSWATLFAIEMALFARPFNAAANVLALQLFLVLVNNAKYHSLREPFIFQDFEYFTDALRHPRLYLPFLGAGRALVAILAVSAAVYAGLALEEPVLAAPFSNLWFGQVSLMLFVGLAVAWSGNLGGAKLTFDPATDLQQLGLFSSLWHYGRAESQLVDAKKLPVRLLPPAPRANGQLPHIVVVQSESFFDARRLFPGIRRSLLKEFDQISEVSCHAGRLAVPAWGANTVRSEFEFLSGQDSDSLGIHRFNPYRKLARQSLPTLAKALQSLGYRTLCLHPYPGSFYRRGSVMPLLGFDEFIDSSGFEGAATYGPYVSDHALLERVKASLGERDTPTFIFVITMENHGPLHWEKVAPGDVERLYDSPPPANCDDLTVYLRHLCNADHMIGGLRRHLEGLSRQSLFCFYGDHVPIMPNVYSALNAEEHMTDYFLWNSCHTPMATRTDLAAKDLAPLILGQLR